MTKPKVKLIGQDGNIFFILAKCTEALKREKQFDEAEQLQEKVFQSKSYHEALAACREYVNVR